MKKIWKTCILLCAVMMLLASCAKKETPAANTLTAEQQAAKEKFIAKLTALKAQGDKQQAADSLRADTVARLLSPAKTVKDTLAVLKSIALAKNVSNQVAVQKTETVAQPSSLEDEDWYLLDWGFLEESDGSCILTDWEQYSPTSLSVTYKWYPVQHVLELWRLEAKFKLYVVLITHLTPRLAEKRLGSASGCG